MKNPKLFLLALGLSLPVLAAQADPAPVTVAATAPVAPAPMPATGAAADVNGEKIMNVDVNRLLESVKASEPSYNTGTPTAIKALAQIRQQILDELITTRLLAQEARRRKIVAPTAEVDKALAEISGGYKNDAEFRAALAKDGKTPEDLRKVISDELAIRQLSKLLTADVAVTGDDIAVYYRNNLDKFLIPEGLKARHILLAINPNAPQAEKDRVRKRAMDLIKQLQNGGDFAKLAQANSDDPGSKQDGGNLGAFTHGQMVKPFEDAAFAAQPGKIIGPVQTEFGLHIIRVDEKLPERTVPLSEVQANPQMKAFLLKDKVQARLEENIKALRAAAKIQKSGAP